MDALQQRGLEGLLREYFVMPLSVSVPREIRAAPHGCGGCVGTSMLRTTCTSMHDAPCASAVAQARLRKRDNLQQRLDDPRNFPWLGLRVLYIYF